MCGINKVFTIVYNEPQMQMTWQIADGSLMGLIWAPGKWWDAMVVESRSLGWNSGSDDQLCDLGWVIQPLQAPVCFSEPWQLHMSGLKVIMCKVPGILHMLNKYLSVLFFLFWDLIFIVCKMAPILNSQSCWGISWDLSARPKEMRGLATIHIIPVFRVTWPN